MKTANSKGSVLIVSLWVIIFFSMMTAALGVRTRSQISAVQRFQNASEDRIAAYSGVSYVLDFLYFKKREKEKGTQDQTQPAAVSPLPWFSDPQYFKDIAVPGSSKKISIGYYSGENGGKNGDSPQKTGQSPFFSPFSYGLQDEGSKINLNVASEEVLSRAFTVGGGDASALAKAVIEWRERKEPFLEFGHSTKIEATAERVEGEGPAGFGSVEELLLVPGVTPDLWNRVRGSLTVYGKGVNLNTAPKETLVLLGLDPALVDRIIAYREVYAQSKDRPDADPRPFKDLGDLTQKVGVSSEENSQLANISSVWIFDVDTFRFLSVTWDSADEKKPHGVECVADHEGRLLFFRDLLTSGTSID